MPASSRVSLSDLPKGHEFTPASFDVSEEYLARYLDAVQDTNTLYRERSLAPPLATAALALGSLLETLELPAGTLHTGQEIEMSGGVPIGARVTLRGRVAQRSERAGLIISVLEFDLTPEGAAAPALSGRTTVMIAPGGLPS
jgi:hypothetical protein